MPDSDNTYLAKIAKSLKAIETAFSGGPLPPVEDMNVTVLNFPPVQEVAVNNFPGAFNVGNFPLSFQVSNFPAFPSSLEVSNFPSSFAVSNFPVSFQVSNFPTEISVNNFPLGFQVAGTVSVDNFPVSFQVSNFPASFAVSNFPATQPVSGSVAVSNFPATQPVSVTNFPATQPVSGAVSVSNFPATQPVSGAVAVNNFPATQPVSGAVSVSNFPATQPVSAAALPLPAGASTEATLALLLARVGTTNYGKTVNYFSLNQGAAGTVAIAAASPGNRHKVVGFMVTLASNGTVQFLSNATALTGLMDVLARGNLTDPVTVLEPSFQTAVGEVLNLTSVGGGAKGFVAYLTEP